MNEADILASTYYDLAEVYQSDEKEIDRETVREYRLIKAGIPCALSKQKQGAHQQGTPQATVSSEMLLFCHPDEDIKEGTKLRVNVMGGNEYEAYIAGKPFRYASHLEIPLIQEMEI